MKTITKREKSLPCLDKAKKNKLTWEKFATSCKTEYLEVRDIATREQGSECAYTGLWLGENTNFHIHLDHFHLRSIYPRETFEWHNLFAAVHNKPYGSDCKDSIIKAPKQHADAQYSAFWSPFEPDLQKRFWYRTDGKVEPAPNLEDSDREMAEETIRMYNLNHPDLCHRREGIMRDIQVFKEQNVSEEMIKEAFSTSGFSFVLDFVLAQ